MFHKLKKFKLRDILSDSKNFLVVNKKVLTILAASAAVATGTYYIYKKSKLGQQKQKAIEEQEKQSTDVSEDSDELIEEDLKSSLSNVDFIKCEHYDIILNFDSETNIIQTSVNYHFKVQKETNEILLDMDQQEIIYCVIEGLCQKFEIKDIQSEQQSQEGVKELDQNIQSNSKQLRIELGRQVQVGEKLELTINSICRQINNPFVKLFESQNIDNSHKVFISTGKGNQSIFPCQNYPSAMATFDITIVTKCLSISQGKFNQEKAQLKGIASGQYLASYQYSDQNYTVFRCRSRTQLQKFHIIIANIEEVQINESISVFQIRGQHNINTIQERFSFIQKNPNLYEKLQALNQEYEKKAYFIIMPKEIDYHHHYNCSLEPMQFIPSHHIEGNCKTFKELALKGIVISQIYDHLNFNNNTLQKVNKEILAYFIKLGLQKICNQNEIEQKKHVFEQINEDNNFFNKIQKKFDKEQIEQCLTQYLSKTCLCQENEEEIQNNVQFEKQIYKQLKKTKHIQFKNVCN
ncbi:peptidase family M1 protein (macronuclear) [Tetrahymena thermophila SB210]|uniref:Peptidase family M1 protein n=1 Tax=Tetrahymena thermophila (strain SB210) TaxID=312017 RepID=I7M385_TETTS|nr:peptidase family M1 protein [Tetrahymena thermophila SB210]EAS02664.3 peptidase family M1 protein [Tetrahymena thermophila SB210]|eukprot:XP_001022909.3 peptidase family M1 protein [Tetrahymena thermophila SB210]